MDTLIAIGLLIFGFIILIKGADWLVDGASDIAKKMNISDIVIGLTIVSFGTSAPELVVNISAALEGKNEMIFGNVLGSNIFNTCLILGVAGVIYPLVVQKSTFRTELPLSILLVGLVYVLANDALFLRDANNMLSSKDGVLLLSIFLGFLAYIYITSQKDRKKIKEEIKEEIKESIEEEIPMVQSLMFVAVGITGLIFGGNLVLDNAVELAQMFGLTERVIALTVVAIGTSLPELATSAVAAMKKNSDIAVGNVVGSNIFNLLLVLGASAFASDVAYNTAANFDIYFLLAISAVLFIFVLAGKQQPDPNKPAVFVVGKMPSAFLLASVLAYVVYVVVKA